VVAPVAGSGVTRAGRIFPSTSLPRTHLARLRIGACDRSGDTRILRRYQKVVDRLKREAVGKLDELLGGPRS
jgi:hypothetical protein